MTHEHSCICPYCDRHMDRVQEVLGDEEDHMPEDGDVTLCIGCGSFSVFDSSAKGGLRKPSPTDLEEIALEPELRRVWRAWALTMGKGETRQ